MLTQNVYALGLIFRRRQVVSRQLFVLHTYMSYINYFKEHVLKLRHLSYKIFSVVNNSNKA